VPLAEHRFAVVVAAEAPRRRPCVAGVVAERIAAMPT
jgi:hypothetical protein